MAAFKVLKEFAIAPEHDVRHLTVGAVYQPGHDVTGLIAAEAGELLLLAPEGTFEPLDAEAQTVAGWAARKRTEAEADIEPLDEADDGVKTLKVGGSVSASGSTRAKRGGA